MADYFCRRDTWQMVFRELASTSDAILIDLRGFRAEHEGARLELETVASTIDLHRVVVLVDGHTDRALVDGTLAGRAEKAGVVSVSDDSRGATDKSGAILEALCVAAGRAPEQAAPVRAVA